MEFLAAPPIATLVATGAVAASLAETANLASRIASAPDRVHTHLGIFEAYLSYQNSLVSRLLAQRTAQSSTPVRVRRITGRYAPPGEADILQLGHYHVDQTWKLFVERMIAKFIVLPHGDNSGDNNEVLELASATPFVSTLFGGPETEHLEVSRRTGTQAPWPFLFRHGDWLSGGRDVFGRFANFGHTAGGMHFGEDVPTNAIGVLTIIIDLEVQGPSASGPGLDAQLLSAAPAHDPIHWDLHSAAQAWAPHATMVLGAAQATKAMLMGMDIEGLLQDAQGRLHLTRDGSRNEAEAAGEIDDSAFLEFFELRDRFADVAGQLRKIGVSLADVASECGLGRGGAEQLRPLLYDTARPWFASAEVKAEMQRWLDSLDIDARVAEAKREAEGLEERLDTLRSRIEAKLNGPPRISQHHAAIAMGLAEIGSKPQGVLATFLHKGTSISPDRARFIEQRAGEWLDAPDAPAGAHAEENFDILHDGTGLPTTAGLTTVRKRLDLVLKGPPVIAAGAAAKQMKLKGSAARATLHAFIHGGNGKISALGDDRMRNTFKKVHQWLSLQRLPSAEAAIEDEEEDDEEDDEGDEEEDEDMQIAHEQQRVSAAIESHNIGPGEVAMQLGVRAHTLVVFRYKPWAMSKSERMATLQKVKAWTPTSLLVRSQKRRVRQESRYSPEELDDGLLRLTSKKQRTGKTWAVVAREMKVAGANPETTLTAFRNQRARCSAECLDNVMALIDVWAPPEPPTGRQST